LAALARRHRLTLCVDNTFATPALCRPLRHGADLVVHSATKHLGGHHDLTAGVVAGRRDLIDDIRRGALLYGPTLGPVDAWLALRGIRTLAPRVAWMSVTAREVADFLAAHPAVAAVRYPGSPHHAQADLAGRLLPDGAGGMLAFDLVGGRPAADRLIRRLELIPYALSFGGVSTTLCFPPEPAGRAEASIGTIRMSIGLEAADDIIADLTQALDGLPSPPASAQRAPRPLRQARGARSGSPSPIAMGEGARG
jgi:cystathionine beta-lyase/cystathionine gamma-synthase